MKVGMIGTGNIGFSRNRLLVAHGREVTFGWRDIGHGRQSVTGEQR